jgi:HlyD family secretion protein
MTPTNTPNDLEALLGPDAKRSWWRRSSVWAGIALAVLLIIGGFWWQGRQSANSAPRYITVPLSRGDIAVTVSANGTLQPTRSVSIGSELSGTVARVLVDVNDTVKQGQALVVLDTAKLQDAITNTRAALLSAQATVAQNNASLQEARATLTRLEEVAQLSGGKVPSKSELDTGRANLARAQANLAAAQAAVTQAQANLSTNDTNLAKATIRSPIDGVVLTRTVEPGSSVAASLQAVTLLTIAEDLHHMKISVNVDEADVGQVQLGQRATFTVAAQAGRQYPAKITRVAYGSTTTDNVITYTTEMAVINDDLSLRPGMTASATIAATEHASVLRAPNTALRFTPANAKGAAKKDAAGTASGGIVSRLMPRPPGMGGARRPEGPGASLPAGQRRLWVLEQGQPKAIVVQTGLSDGKLTEVSGEGLREGMAVIVEQAAATP